MKDKVRIRAPLIIDKMPKGEYSKYKSYAGAVDFPLEKQKDLLYFKAVFVSSGTNKNAVTFLSSELVKARGTVPNKAVDLEHNEENVVGHIYSHAFVFPDGREFNPEQLLAELKYDWKKVDDLDMDIVVAGVLYKARFPELAEQVNNDEWFVSMEAFFEDFDIKVGNIVIPKSTAESLGLGDSIGNIVKAKFSSSNREYHDSLVSRVLRNILFSGAGIVKDPANPNSVVLETAATKEGGEGESGFPKSDLTVDLSEIVEGTVTGGEPDKSNSEVEDNKVVAKKIIEKYERLSRFIVLKIDGEGEDAKFKAVDSFIDWASATRKILELMSDGGDSRYTIVDYYTVFSTADDNVTLEEIVNEEKADKIYEVNENGEVVAVYVVRREPVGIAGHTEKAITYLDSPTAPFNWTPPSLEEPSRRSITEGICASFKKYLYERQGSTNPGSIIQEHWCSLFDESCPVIGASAKDSKCLRNIYNRTTKNPEDNTMSGDDVRPTRSETAAVYEDIKNKLNNLNTSIDAAKTFISKKKVVAKKWTRKFINSLPNASFAAVESDVKSKNGRHLPHHGPGGGGTSNVNLDTPHLRNAFARVNQVKAVGKTSDAALRKRALNHLNKHRSALKTDKSSLSKDDEQILLEIDSLYEKANLEINGKEPEDK